VKKLIAATTTPLASIFGSGFLIIVPILAGAVGRYSVFAMAAVCLFAYAVGSVIRYNIRHAEPLLAAGKTSELTTMAERASDLAIIGAYVISVCLYIKILTSFLLSGLDTVWSGIDNAITEHLVVVVIIAAIGTIGYVKGLEILEKLESIALWITIVIIGVLFVGFGAYDLGVMGGDGIQWPAMPDHSWWEILTIIGGTLIVVQGFETSRYLGEEYDADTRIKSSRVSQVISTLVYVIFLALATPLMHFLEGLVEDNGLILLAAKASVLLPIPLVLAAVLSQFSAAVADTMGGGGNMAEVTKEHVSSRCAYLLISGGAVALAFVPTLTILALASRAFAFYYMLQCFVAMGVTKNALRRLAYGCIAAVLAFIVVFSVPAG
jgi:hypothetical protein